MDTLLTLLGVAGVTYVMGVPGADDVMLSYQSTSFHDALYLRGVLGLRPAPEFEEWLDRVGISGAATPERMPGWTVTCADRSATSAARIRAHTAGRRRHGRCARVGRPAIILVELGGILPLHSKMTGVIAQSLRDRRWCRRTGMWRQMPRLE